MPAELRVGSQLVVIGTMLAWKKCQRFANIWAKSKKKKGRDVLSRISNLQRSIRTTTRRFVLHASSRFDRGQGGSERFTLLHCGEEVVP